MKPKPDIVIFLDVDGVLNRCAASNHGLESDKVELLGRIVDATRAGIVVSSTWRETSHQRERLVRLFHQIGADFCGWTPDLKTQRASGIIMAPERGVEIQAWLTAHPEVRHFIILDDCEDMANLSAHLIKTESYTGLTSAIADEAVRRLLDVPPWDAPPAVEYRWAGDLTDDCCLNVGEFRAHAELLCDDVICRSDGDRWEEETWFLAVYRGDEVLFHSGEPGGRITSGEMARSLGEAIVRAAVRSSDIEVEKKKN